MNTVACARWNMVCILVTSILAIAGAFLYNASILVTSDISITGMRPYRSRVLQARIVVSIAGIVLNGTAIVGTRSLTIAGPSGNRARIVMTGILTITRTPTDASQVALAGSLSGTGSGHTGMMHHQASTNH